MSACLTVAVAGGVRRGRVPTCGSGCGLMRRATLREKAVSNKNVRRKPYKKPDLKKRETVAHVTEGTVVIVTDGVPLKP